MRTIGIIMALMAVAAPARAGGLAVAPPSVDLGTIHAGDVKTFTFRLINGGAKPAKNVACRGARFTFAPARVTLAPGTGVDVVATYTEKKALHLIGRLDAAIKCGAARLPIAGVWNERPAVDPRPTDALGLARAMVRPTAWTGLAYSPSAKLIKTEHCGDPMNGDDDACCTVSLSTLDGVAKVDYVIANDSCRRAGARTADDVARELATRFQKEGWLALDDENWIFDARVLPDGRLLVRRDGAVWLGDQRVAAAPEPHAIAFTPDLKTVLVFGDDRWVPITLP